MQFATQMQMTPVSAIIVDRPRRQRREVSTKGLLESIRARGIMNPLVIMPSGRLVAGERRLSCAIELGLAEVPTRLVTDLSPIEAQLIELEENTKRLDLPWQDIVRAMVAIHGLYLSQDQDWTMAETAAECGVSQGLVSMYLKVGASLDEDRILACSTVREAYNLLGRRDQRAAGEALNELLETCNEIQVPKAPTLAYSEADLAGDEAFAEADILPRLPLVDLAPARPRYHPEDETIINESFLFWAPKYQGRKFNLIHCDFPYGINVFQGPQGGGTERAYEDDPEIYKRLLDCFLTHFDRFASQSCHAMFWFSEAHRDFTMAQFRERLPSVVWVRHPLIWFKSCNTGIASDARRTPRHVYETALLGYRGSRNLVKTAADCYAGPVNKQLHPSTKPEPMLKHFFSMLVDEHSEVFDPTCGSAAALRAGESLGAKRVFGMDTDTNVVGLARTELRKSRILRGAA